MEASKQATVSMKKKKKRPPTAAGSLSGGELLGGGEFLHGQSEAATSQGVPHETGDAAFKGLKVEPAGNPRGGNFRGEGILHGYGTYNRA